MQAPRDVETLATLGAKVTSPQSCRMSLMLLIFGDGHGLRTRPHTATPAGFLGPALLFCLRAPDRAPARRASWPILDRALARRACTPARRTGRGHRGQRSPVAGSHSQRSHTPGWPPALGRLE